MLSVNEPSNYGKVKYIVERPYTYIAYPDLLIIPRINELDNVLNNDPMDNAYLYQDYRDTREYRRIIIRY